MSDCSKYMDLCSAMIDGEITREEKRELEAHLESCPDCAAYLEDLRWMRDAWHVLEEQGPASLHEDIMAGIEAEAQKTVMPLEKKRRPLPVFTMLAAAAACVMLVASGSLSKFFNTGGSSAPTVGVNMAMADAGNATGEAGAAGAAPRAQMYDAGAQPESDEAMAPQTGEKAGSQTVALPESLVQQVFAACYTAAGSGELPTVEGAILLEQDGSTSYFKMENNMSRLEKASQVLAQAGYLMTLREDLGVRVDPKASDVLLIVMTEDAGE